MSDETVEITGDEDLIDSHKIMARIVALEAAIAEIEENEFIDHDTAAMEIEDLQAELDMLRAVAIEGAGMFTEWANGVTLVNDGYFEDFAQEEAESIHGIDVLHWPFDSIDWKDAASNLQVDYLLIEINGEDFWGRA